MKSQIICSLVGVSIASLVSTHSFAAPYDGFYIGGQAGYASTNTKLDRGDRPSPDLDANGGIVGVLAGWGTQFNPNWYIGLEAQFNWMGGLEGDEHLVGNEYGWEADSQWGISARLGYLVSPATMIYGRVGYVQASADMYVHIPGIDPALTHYLDVDDSDGSEFAIGVEHDLGNNWTVRGEYTYTDYGNADVTATVAGDRFEFGHLESDAQSFRIGVSLNF